MNFVAVEEGVITILDKDTSEPLAIIRKNGKTLWYAIKGEMSWNDYQELLEVNKRHE